MMIIGGLAWASHLGGPINLTTAGAQGNHDGGYLIQGGVGAGTGNFDPFLTVSGKGNATVEAGFNSCDEGSCTKTPDAFYGGGRTHELLASAVPVLHNPPGVPAGDYREFTLDANEEGSDDFISIDTLQLFFSADPDVSGYVAASDTFTSGATTLFWDLDAGKGHHPILMRTQTLTPGSGVSDITLLVPDSFFPDECDYGDPDCLTYVVMYMDAGHYTGGSQDWGISAGFEEWRVSLQPVVNVTKTVDVDVVRDYDWTILKEVSVDGGTTWFDANDPGSYPEVNIFDGASHDIKWRVTTTKDAGTLTGYALSGTISILNPTGGDGPIADAIPAEINSVTDVVTIDGVPTGAAVECGVSFPYTLGAGDTLECTYSLNPGTGPTNGNVLDDYNTATANIDVGEGTMNYSDVVDLNGVTPSETAYDDTATVDDDLEPGAIFPVGTSISDSWTYDDSVSCGGDEGAYVNTATVTEDDSNDQDSDPAGVTVVCHEPGVSKTAAGHYNTYYDWTITKEVSIDGGTTWVDAATVNLFTGDSKAIKWRVTATRLPGTDADHWVDGIITITNPNPDVDMTVDLADALDSGETASAFTSEGGTDCSDASGDAGWQVFVAKNGGSVQCGYSMTTTGESATLNTATVTLNSIDYTDDAAVSYSLNNEIDETATITDDLAPGGTFTGGSSPWVYDDSVSCDTDEGEYSNTAVVTEDDTNETDNDTATVTVNCYQPTVSKTATPHFTRTYDWSIDKDAFLADGSVVPVEGLMIDEGQSYNLEWRVTVDVTGYTDSDWYVTGTITINNPNPDLDMTVDLTDALDTGETATSFTGAGCIDADVAGGWQVFVGAGSSVDCGYSIDDLLGDGSYNEATITLNAIDYDSNQASFDYSGDPTSEVNATVQVTDTFMGGSEGVLGTATVAEAPKTFYVYTLLSTDPSHNPDVLLECGLQDIVNRADVYNFDDGVGANLGFDTRTVPVDVTCIEACTLTQGYWKTHNDSFWGGAPTDLTWELLGDVDGDGVFEYEEEDFFLSGDTWFDVFWMAPKGNAYYNLAHQYMAAYLNTLNGAPLGAWQADFDEATALFETWTPGDIAALKGNNAVRKDFIRLNDSLTHFNEDNHCDEDASSAN